jgi:hypothetical protein
MKAVPHPTPWLYGDRLRAVGIKFFADGALGSRGAWLKQPYADKPDSRGLQFHSDAEILALTDQAAAAGFQIATHAIGDAANAQMISTYEQLRRKYPGDRRWRIEHFQIVDPADIPRLAPAGIIASMQPTHQTSDRLMAEARLGTKRLAGAYAWQSVLKSGGRLAFGTDFPVESPNPFPGLSAAISRQDVNGQPPGGWIPSERLTLGEALLGHQPVARLVGRLHRGDDPRWRKARDVGRIDDLEMLDPPAAVAPVFARELLINADHLRIGRIADGVRCGLEAGGGRAVLHCQKLGVRMAWKAARIALVGIGLLEPGAARAQRSVGEEFRADHPQLFSVEPRRRAGHLRKRTVQRIRHQAHFQPAGVTGATIGVPVVERCAHCADSGHSEAVQEVL